MIFKVHYLLPERNYSVNNFSLTYVLHSNDPSQISAINRIDEIDYKFYNSITVLIVNSVTTISLQIQDKEGNIIFVPRTNTSALSFQKQFHTSDLSPLTHISTICSKVYTVEIKSEKEYCFIEAEYV